MARARARARARERGGGGDSERGKSAKERVQGKSAGGKERAISRANTLLRERKRTLEIAQAHFRESASTLSREQKGTLESPTLAIQPFR